MAGHIVVVHKVIDDKYPSAALFFHCASHVLYLVINDLNTVSEVRNISGTTNGIINFFSSTLGQNYISDITLFRETLLTTKYKSLYRVIF